MTTDDDVAIKIVRSTSLQINVVDFLLLIQNSKLIRLRDRSLDADNRRQQKFKTTTHRISS
jgi:hypothetical protein